MSHVYAYIPLTCIDKIPRSDIPCLKKRERERGRQAGRQAGRYRQTETLRDGLVSYLRCHCGKDTVPSCNEQELTYILLSS